MHEDMIWGNDEKYTKEYQIKCKEEQQRRHNELLVRLNKQEEEKKKEQQIIGSALRKHEEELRARGEIVNPFIRQRLEAKIKAARWFLALAMAMTLLFKGFWIIWIICILLYFFSVNRFKKEALEADLKSRKK